MIKPLIIEIREFKVSNSQDQVTAFLTNHVNNNDYSLKRMMVNLIKQEGD